MNQTNAFGDAWADIVGQGMSLRRRRNVVKGVVGLMAAALVGVGATIVLADDTHQESDIAASLVAMDASPVVEAPDFDADVEVQMARRAAFGFDSDRELVLTLMDDPAAATLSGGVILTKAEIDELGIRLELQTYDAALAEAANELGGGGYLGSFLDHASGGVLWMTFETDQSAHLDFLTTYVPEHLKERIKIRTDDQGLLRLRKGHAELSSAIAASWPDFLVNVGLDEQAGVIVATVEPGTELDAARRALVELVPASSGYLEVRHHAD